MVNSKKPVSMKENLISHKRKTDFRSNSSPVNRILYLQRTIGNQAVQRMVRSGALQAKLRIGQPGDVYEQEADRVADAVKWMPEPQVQQQAEEEEEEEEPIQTELNGSIQQQPEEEEEEELVTPKVQEKLTMGSPGDVYEQEADQVAEAISTEGGLSDLSNMTSVQQKLLSSLDPRALGGFTERTIKPMVSTDTVGSKKLSVNRKQELPPQGDGSVPASIEGRILQSKGGGNSLPQHMQNYMAIQAGYDFSNVRVKTDPEAAELNSALGARAFTNGSDIWLGKGEKVTDVKLMAHELTHVVQQGGAGRIQPQSNTFSSILASKGFMPKFIQTLTKNTEGNSAHFQKDILKFAKENPSERMTASQSKILENSQSGMSNLRENAQTLRGCMAGCAPAPTPATPTLTKSTVSGPTPSNCGGFSWGVQWSINNASTLTNGWVVQKVDEKRGIKYCNGKNKKNPSWYRPSPFWEAWQVRGGRVYVGRTKSLHNADTFSENSHANTKGTIKILGTAEYYDGLTLPTSFKVTNKAPAMSLPMTRSKQTLSGGTGSLAHNLTATWDCCTSNKNTKLTTK